MAPLQNDLSYFRSYLAQGRLPGSPPLTLDDLNDTQVERDVVIRRVLERASFGAYQILDAIDEAGVPKGAIYATGGWSRSRAFVELRASIFGEAINAVGDMELTAMGAALHGTEAATGKPACPFQNKDIVTVEPVKEWLSGHESVYSTFIRDQASFD